MSRTLLVTASGSRQVAPLPALPSEVFRLDRFDQRIIVGAGGNPDVVDLWADQIGVFDFKQPVGLSVPGPRAAPVRLGGQPGLLGDGIETQYLTTQNISAMLPGGAGQKFYGMAVVQMLELLPARGSDAGAFVEPALLGDTGLFFYLTVSVGGVSMVLNVAGYKPTPPALPLSGTMLGFTGTRHAIEFGYDGTNLLCRVDNGTQTSRATGPLPAGVGFPMALFGVRTAPGSVPLAKGIMQFCNLVGDYPTLGNRNALRAYISAAFPGVVT